MKAHIGLTRSQIEQVKKLSNQTADSTIYLHNFLWLMSLHDTFGFSNSRLQKVCDTYRKYCSEFNSNLDADLSVAIEKVVRCMESYDIDYENLLNCKAYQIYDNT